MGAFEPVHHQPLATLAATAVRDAIMDGRLQPGAKVVEVQIAAALGFSRAPLREALRILEEEGLVVRHPYRGSFVVEVSRQTVAEIASLRDRLEPYAAELAMPHLRSPAGRMLVKRTTAALRSAVAGGDVHGCVDAHLTLHRCLYELAEHTLLLDSWQTWETKLRLYAALDALTSTGALLDDHERLARVLLEGDSAEVTAALRQHTRHAAVCSPSDSTPDPTESPSG